MIGWVSGSETAITPTETHGKSSGIPESRGPPKPEVSSEGYLVLNQPGKPLKKEPCRHLPAGLRGDIVLGHSGPLPSESAWLPAVSRFCCCLSFQSDFSRHQICMGKSWVAPCQAVVSRMAV